MKATIRGESVVISRSSYRNNDRIALEAFCLDGERFAVLTVNLTDAFMEDTEAAIDINNLGLDIIRELRDQNIIGEQTTQARSGFVLYPIHKILI